MGKNNTTPDSLLPPAITECCPVVVVEEDDARKGLLQYTIDQIPPVPVTIFVAIQHILLSLTGALTMSTVVSDVLCAGSSHSIRAQLFATTIFMAGFSTIIQTTLGIRLPVFQGPSSSFLVPVIAVASLEGWQCSDPSTTTHSLTALNGNSTAESNNILNYTGQGYTLEEKLQQLSGSLMLASLLEVAIGGLGIIGPLMRLIGPLTVAPTISLIGLSLYKLPVIYARFNPLISLGSAILVIFFSLYLAKIRVPMPNCCKGGKRQSIPVFQLFPILLAMAVMWGLCGILTVAGVFPDDVDDPMYMSRTDAKTDIIRNTPWFYVPHPGQFGPPSFNIAATVGFGAAIIASLVESVGDYFAAAKCCQVMPPPDHAISRGILIEGVGSLLSGAVGAAHATTSFSGNIAMLTLTKTASRSVLVVAGFILIGLSVVGKVGAIVATLPPPIIGGIFLVVLGLLASLGISTLSYVDMSSNRNILITGIAFMTGFSVPGFLEEHGDMLKTGSDVGDQIIHVVLGTPMFLGGMVALVLDNTVPGTEEERGMTAWRKTHSSASTGNDDNDGYDSNNTNKQEKEKFMEESASLNAGHNPRDRDLSENEVYGFACLNGKCGDRLARFIPFLPSSVHAPKRLLVNETVSTPV